jgi:tetratricopeptide (TPR) repeat protein
MPVTPPLRVPGRLSWEAANGRGDLDDRPRFTPDGRRLLVPVEDGVFAIDLTPEPRPVAELEPVARILAGHEVDAAGGFQPLSGQAATEARDRWRQLYPAPRVGPAPGYAEELIRSAITQKTWRTADRLLGEYLRDHPDAGWAWAQRATAREHLGRLADAKADWDEAIRRADGPTARGRRGNVLAQLGKYTEAAADLAAAWAATGEPAAGARLALCQWAAGDRAGYRRTCEQLRDRRDEFPRDTAGLTLAALACGLDPTGADLVGPFVPPLEGLMSAAAETDMLRALALGYVRTGNPGKAGSLLGEMDAKNDYYARHHQVLILALPRAGGPLGLTRLRRAGLVRAIDDWYERDHEVWNWADRLVITELRAQGKN